MSDRMSHNNGPEGPTNRLSGADGAMSRQQFLREGLSRFVQGLWGASEAVPVAAEASVSWLRPPGALPEAEFVAACTRCDLCVKVCPHWALKVATRHDAPPAGTPFLHDPAADACARCPEMPCIAACPTGALRPLEAPAG